MNISGPDRYKLAFDADSFRVTCQKGTPRFSGSATSQKPKLYIASIDEEPIYVGVTRQPIRNRLRGGWSANGKTGYYGYAWRRDLKEANLDIWCHEDAPTDNPSLDIETIEAEVVFLIRCPDSGQNIKQRYIFTLPPTSTGSAQSRLSAGIWHCLLAYLTWLSQVAKSPD